MHCTCIIVLFAILYGAVCNMHKQMLKDYNVMKELHVLFLFVYPLY